MRLAAAALLALVFTACSAEGPGAVTTSTRSATTQPTTTTAPATTTTAATTTSVSTTRGSFPPTLRVVQIAEAARPVDLAPRAGDDAFYIVEKGGTVRAYRAGSGLDGQAVLDISGEVSNGSEQGLLGLAFAPDGSHLYINYTDLDGDTHIEEWAFAGGQADPASRRELLQVDQPFANHNGGSVVFGPDGLLYLGLGDGGSGGDPDGNGQNLGTLLGKILRIDPTPSGGQPYTIPPDNPFVGRPDARAEIYSYGLRNPWRFSFDAEPGDLWIGDVGQNAWEEIDRVGPGEGRAANFGWDLLEGSHPFEADSAPGTVLPVYEFENGGGACSVTGGFVYRGRAVPTLTGAYIFGDYCLGEIEVLWRDGTGFEHESLGLLVPSISSLGQDNAGEVYVLDLNGGVYRLDAG